MDSEESGIKESVPGIHQQQQQQQQQSMDGWMDGWMDGERMGLLAWLENWKVCVVRWVVALLLAAAIVNAGD